MLQYELLLIYVIVNVLLFIINWSLFTTTMELNLGLAVLDTLPFLILQIFGGFINFWAIKKSSQNYDYGTRDLLKKITVLQFQKEILLLKKNQR